MLFDPYQLQKCSKNSIVTDTSLNEMQKQHKTHLSMHLRIFCLKTAMGIGPNDSRSPFYLVIQATMHLPVPGREPTLSVFVNKCVAYLTTVAVLAVIVSAPKCLSENHGVI